MYLETLEDLSLCRQNSQVTGFFFPPGYFVVTWTSQGKSTASGKLKRLQYFPFESNDKLRLERIKAARLISIFCLIRWQDNFMLFIYVQYRESCRVHMLSLKKSFMCCIRFGKCLKVQKRNIKINTIHNHIIYRCLLLTFWSIPPTQNFILILLFFT